VDFIPFNKKGNCLIGTPIELVKSIETLTQDGKNFSAATILANMLVQARLLKPENRQNDIDKKLFIDYKQQLKEKLNKSFSTQKFNQVFALHLLNDHLDEFKSLWIKQLTVIDIKKHLLLLPLRLINILSLYYNIYEDNSLKRLNKLVEHKHIHKDVESVLLFILHQIYQWRLEAHLIGKIGEDNLLLEFNELVLKNEHIYKLTEQSAHHLLVIYSLLWHTYVLSCKWLESIYKNLANPFCNAGIYPHQILIAYPKIEKQYLKDPLPIVNYANCMLGSREATLKYLELIEPSLSKENVILNSIIPQRIELPINENESPQYKYGISIASFYNYLKQIEQSLDAEINKERQLLDNNKSEKSTSLPVEPSVHMSLLSKSNMRLFPDPTSLLKKAKALLATDAEENIGEALKILDELVNSQPKEPQFRLIRGKCYVNSNIRRSKDALQEFNQAINNMPSSSYAQDKEIIAQAYFERGLTYFYDKQFELALKDFTEAIKNKPEYAVAYAFRAQAFMSIKRYGEAENDFAKALKLAPTDWRAYLNRARLFCELGRYEAALNDARQAETLNPNASVTDRVRKEIEEKMAEQTRIEQERCVIC
jgi:tetratricopeptide (TPR) repeat protein